MAIETSFTIKHVSVDEALKQAEAKADKTAKRIDNSLNSTSSGAKQASAALEQMGRGMDSVNKSGGRIGGVLKNATEAVKGMLNPIGLVSAAFTALTAIIVGMWEKAKAKAEALAKSYAWQLQQAQNATSSINTRQTDDNRYLERLDEIRAMETRNISVMMEAQRIIEHLTRTYGDLGLSINSATGEILGMTEATKKMMEWQKQERYHAAQAELTSQRGARDSALRAAYSVRGGIDEVVDELGNPPELSLWNEIAMVYDRIGDTRAGECPGWTEGWTESSLVGYAEEYRKKREPDAFRRYWSLNGGKKNGIIPDDYEFPDEMISPAAKKLMDQWAELQEKAKKSSGEVAKSYMAEADIVFEMAQMTLAQTAALELENVNADDDEKAEKWRKVVEEVQKYYVILEKLRNLERTGRLTEEDSIDIMTEANKRVEASQKALDAEKDRTKASDDSLSKNQMKAFKRMSNPNPTKQDQWQDLQDEIRDYKFQTTKMELDKDNLESDARKIGYEQTDLVMAQKVQGEWDSEADLKKWTDLEDKRLKILIDVEKMQQRINERKQEELRMSERSNELDAQIKHDTYNQAMTATSRFIKNLGKGMWSDTGIRTDSLRQRGGYMTGVNAGGLDIQRNIYLTVLTANRYLSGIKQILSSAGII